MSLASGTRLGAYEIASLLGEGGMGQVYRARDTRLGRDVAIKVLPHSFTEDAERLARFEREARTLAKLSHPNIASIYGLEEADGARALVMELVPGSSLAERLKDGPLPVEDVVPVFRQIADALEAAHEQGIVHRDLKPQNIQLREDGQVKVLDFGLAKALAPGGLASGTDAKSPTLTTPAGTALGVILGSAAYMAPEQAKGKAVDRRADVWAFGVVLYECLAGRQLFEGDSIAETLAAVLRQEIDPSALPEGTPEELRRLLRRCLERDPRNRLHDIADARIVLDELHSGRDGRSVYYSSTRGGTMNLWRLAVDPESGNPLGEPTPLTAPSSWVGWISLSGDGRKLVWVDRNARTEILRAPFDPQRGELAGPARPVPLGTFEIYEYFDLTPDGASIVFANVGLPTHLFVAGVDGTGLRQLTDGPYRDRQGRVSPDGQWIVFQTSRYPSQIAMIRSDGSGLREVVSSRTDGWYPSWSADGSRIALSSTDGPYVLDPHAAAPGATEALAAPPDGFNFEVRSVSVDGAWIGGMLRDATARPQALAIYNRAERTYRTLVERPDVNGPWFLPDSRRLLWIEETRLVVADPGSNATRAILTVPAGREISWIALSRDGRWLSWLESGDESDIWMTTLE